MTAGVTRRHSERLRARGELVNEIVAMGAIVLVVLIFFLDVTGFLDNIPWLRDRVPTISLVALGLVLSAAILDRRYHLARIEETIHHVLDNQGFAYLQDSKLVSKELTRIVTLASDQIVAVGSRSTDQEYLRLIERKVSQDRVRYSRFLTGTSITHELHEHLVRALLLTDAKTHVKVFWTQREKYGNLTVTEAAAVLVLPSPSHDRLAGLKMSGREYVDRHLQFAHDIRDEPTAVRVETKTRDDLGMLCEPCNVNDPTPVALRLQTLTGRYGRP